MKKINLISLYFFLGITLAGNSQTEKKTLILPAHAHNDYNHNRPLFDALENNFKSIEADVFMVGDSLFVAHSYNEISPGKTLRKLYLQPLEDLIKKNTGSVYGEGTEILLLIDIKDDGLKTYKLLHNILQDYKSILTTYDSGIKKPDAIAVIVSGNRPIEYIENQKIRYAAFDGRIANLDSKFSSSLMPLVSDNWNQHFKWRGQGEMPSSEKEKLAELVKRVHKNGSMLRFWSTPDQPGFERKSVWKQLKIANVDLIGTDDLEGLNNFLEE